MSSDNSRDDVLVVLRDGAGRSYADAEPLPDLSQVLQHARRLSGLAILNTTNRHSRRSGGEWMLTFTFQGHSFGIHTDYHAAQTLYSSPDADCPEQLMREVVAHFESLRLLPPTWVPPPPLGWRRLLVLGLIALAVALALTLFLVLFREP